MSVNKVTLLGNTGKAPDFKEFDNGGCVATITLATTKRGFTTKDGRQIPERTEWHNIVAWGSLATLVEKYLQKGLLVYVEGKICTRKYTKNNVEHYSTEIVENNIVLLRNNWKDSRAEQAQAAPAPAQAVPAAGTNKDDDLPF